MSKVTYLLGAGASANTIPIVRDLRPRLLEFRGFLKRFLKQNMNANAFDKLVPTIRDNQNILQLFINELTWIYDESNKHHTIDTLAKKYYLKSQDDLNRLKNALIIYFTVEQVVSFDIEHKSDFKGFIKKREFRYDSFFAALIDKNDKDELIVNPNVKILTWNYDQQIELALKSYVDLSIEKIKKKYGIYPNHTSLESSSLDISTDEFGVIKLNGNAIWLTPIVNESESKYSVYNSILPDDPYFDNLGNILEEYRLIDNKTTDHNLVKSLEYFNFSWESDERFINKYPAYDLHRQKAFDIAYQTEYLVIIGYSFPVFNRKVDMELINKMINIKKIYIQDPNAEAIKSTLENGFTIFDNYRNRMLEKEFDAKLPVQRETNTDQFLIPFELS